MLCQNCLKRQASVHVTQIINSEKKELHLCEKCAAQSEGNLNTNSFLLNNIGINDLLAGLLGNSYSLQPKSQNVSSNKALQCPNCKLTYEQFASTGKLGCSNCYNVFSDVLNSMLKRIHGNIKHTGKTPIRTGSAIKLRRELEDLRYNLQQAIKNEEYENAAELRDKIRELDNKKLEGGE